MVFEELFPPSEPKSQTRFGYLTEAEYEEREANFQRRMMQVANCKLCDMSGYRPNGLVCDHVNRIKIAERGIRECRRALSKLKPVNESEEQS
jgi:hypothetical protein